MLIKTADVCRLTGVSWAKLADWVRKGLITPAVKGTKGHGKSHKFTLLQAIGLAFTAPLGWGVDTTTEAVAEFERMDEDELVAWLLEERMSSWAEERVAAKKAARPVLPSPPLPMGPPAEEARMVKRAEEGRKRAREVVEWARGRAKPASDRAAKDLPAPASVLSRNVKK